MHSVTFATADDLGRAAANLAAIDRNELIAVPAAEGGFDVSGPEDIIAALVGAPSKERLLAYAADKRWQVETGGIAVAGAAIDTSRDSQAMITGAYAYSQAHPEEPIKFKAASGWVTLDAATIAAIATAVGAHVQASFAVEESVDAAIAAGTIISFAEIDVAGWPSNGS